uniref:Uncharacterized protein n=1 Tax=Knipowitschia caucasica TaxID=637954 RepID=A0AAV2K0H2_KNICA
MGMGRGSRQPRRLPWDTLISPPGSDKTQVNTTYLHREATPRSDNSRSEMKNGQAVMYAGPGRSKGQHLCPPSQPDTCRKSSQRSVMRGAMRTATPTVMRPELQPHGHAPTFAFGNLWEKSLAAIVFSVEECGVKSRNKTQLEEREREKGVRERGSRAARLSGQQTVGVSLLPGDGQTSSPGMGRAACGAATDWFSAPAFTSVCERSERTLHWCKTCPSTRYRRETQAQYTDAGDCT